MYHKVHGIIETLAPLHVGASAGEETGNLNLIFRDQFTQTGIIPGSSIRGRFRADMRSSEVERASERTWYGHEAATSGETVTTEALVKFEYASLVWFPVFCPGQPIVWVSCPWLLKRYKQITGIQASVPVAYTAAKTIQGRQGEAGNKVLFFNLGFLTIEHLVDEAEMQAWIPEGIELSPQNLVVVDNNDIAMLHDMGLYRQSRVKLSDTEKKVEGGAFFNVEALPEGSILIFPVALKRLGWQPFGAENVKIQELYFGGLESIGFGRCRVTLGGAY